MVYRWRRCCFINGWGFISVVEIVITITSETSKFGLMLTCFCLVFHVYIQNEIINPQDDYVTWVNTKRKGYNQNKEMKKE